MTPFYLKQNLVSLLWPNQFYDWRCNSGKNAFFFKHNNGSRNSFCNYHNSRIISLGINGVVMQMHIKVLNILFFGAGSKLFALNDVFYIKNMVSKLIIHFTIAKYFLEIWMGVLCRFAISL